MSRECSIILDCYKKAPKKAENEQISIHAPAGGASTSRHADYIFLHISIHAPAGGASQSGQCRGAERAYFNSRPCGRGFPYLFLRSIRFFYFNSRPCGRGFYMYSKLINGTPNFNSRPCGRGFSLYFSVPEFKIISIHAPAGGASIFQPKPQERIAISIHAPAGGASAVRSISAVCSIFQFTPLREGLQRPISILFLPCHFNSRPCGRGFAECHLIFVKIHRISIHAPAGGASGDKLCLVDHIVIFQFTPLREGLLSTDIRSANSFCISIHAPAGGAS